MPREHGVGQQERHRGVFARAWVVSPTVIGGTWTGEPSVEEGSTGTFTVTPNVAGSVPTVRFDTCAVTQSGPVGGKYTYTTGPVSADCAFRIEFPSPVLAVSKSASVASAPVGTSFDYVIQVSNTGALATTAPVQVSDSIPTGLTIVAASLPGGCTQNQQVVSCTIAPSLASADTVTRTIRVTATAAATGSTSNTATAAAAVTPPARWRAPAAAIRGDRDGR